MMANKESDLLYPGLELGILKNLYLPGRTGLYMNDQGSLGIWARRNMNKDIDLENPEKTKTFSVTIVTSAKARVVKEVKMEKYLKID